MIKPNVSLYHGSYIPVEKPDLSKCRDGKDFGRGFYLTTSRRQAERFTRTAVRKAESDKIISVDSAEGFVSEFFVDIWEGLQIYEFADADSEWLHCVVAHRRKRGMSDELARWADFDVIGGKIANDHTNLVITAYMDGLYGQIGSERADQIAIELLEPKNLKDQFCFRTVKALERLQWVRTERIAL